METVAFVIFCGAVSLVALMTLGYLVEVVRVLWKLEKSHSEAFRELREPSLFYIDSISHGTRVLRFLLRREYLELHDPAVDRLAGICRLLFVVATATFTVAVLALVVCWIAHPA